MDLVTLRQQHSAALGKAERHISAAERAARPLTPFETAEVDAAMIEAQALAPQIATAERAQSFRALRSSVSRPGTTTFSHSYFEAFRSWVGGAGEGGRLSAALYEGADSGGGGYAVPITVSGQVVPLAPAENAVRSLATVIPTTNDVRLPVETAVGAAAEKSESGGTAFSFANSAPAGSDFLLSAFMAGAETDVSLELMQDVPLFQNFILADALEAQQVEEEQLYLSGSGSGQPQGMLGNVGVGVSEEPDALGNLISLNGLLDLVGSLNSRYQAGGAFLMQRATSILIRKAQVQESYFVPVFSRENGRDLLHGYPVAYSALMPAAARGATPILFGDFAKGYIIGDRGGSNLKIKMLDQTKLVQGLVSILTYRRTDGRVRRSEAIQPYKIATS